MLCDTCRWTGRPGFVRAPGSNQEGPCAMIPCPDCGGQGIAHCCDGICEQPGAIEAASLPPSLPPSSARLIPSAPRCLKERPA